MTTILVCGGRDFAAVDPYTGIPGNQETFYQNLFLCSKLDRYAAKQRRNGITGKPEALTVVQGSAPGADTAAYWWGINGHHRISVRSTTTTSYKGVPGWPALWDRYGKSAGPKRNQEMLDNNKISTAFVFPGGDGTRDMTTRLHEEFDAFRICSLYIYSWRDYELWREGAEAVGQVLNNTSLF